MTFNDIFKSNFLENISGVTILDMALALVLAFGLGIFIFLIYKKTYNGVMYSSSFGVTLIALTMITTVVILAVTSNVVLSLGMVGALSIVRFRTAIKEPLDIAFLFWSIAVGIVLAAGMIPLAVIGSVIIGLILLVFVNRKTHSNPYIVVLQCSSHESEQAAKAYLDEAGYDYTEPFQILVASDSPDFYSMAVIIKGQLEAAGIPCELLTYDWSTFVEIRNNEPDQYNAFITSFAAKTVPSMNLYLSSSWAGWCTDERVQSDLAAINASSSVEEGAQIWQALQQYMWEDYMPVSNFGIQNDLMISTSNVEGLSYLERICYVNAQFVA